MSEKKYTEFYEYRTMTSRKYNRLKNVKEFNESWVLLKPNENINEEDIVEIRRAKNEQS